VNLEFPKAELTRLMCAQSPASLGVHKQRYSSLPKIGHNFLKIVFLLIT